MEKGSSSLSSPSRFDCIMGTSAIDTISTPALADLESNNIHQRAQWLLESLDPPSLWQEFKDHIACAVLPHSGRLRSLRNQPRPKRILLILQEIFPILCWCRNYRASTLKKDVMAGLTLASLSIPESIAYATLAKLDPKYGLYSSVVPPLIYAVMGTSRDLAIGPVAVVSLLLSSSLQKLKNPETDPVAYRSLVFTATFLAGLFQAALGLLRLGYLVDFLSHAAIVGLMGGAAVVIGLQQFKELLGLSNFTTKADVVSVLKSVWSSCDQQWSPHSFMLGFGFLSFILVAKFLGRKSKKLFWLSAIAPLLSVILSTLIVFMTKADKHGVKTVKHIKSGLNPISIHQLQLNNPHIGEMAKISLIMAIISLTEAIAAGRSFASIKGYRLEGNNEIVAMGFMNVVGSFTSCYATTGSFSRTAVNYAAGCETAVSSIVMALTVFLTLELMTRLLFYTPLAILASIILSALPDLIDLREAYNIWKVDKFDFLACAGAFLGVLFASLEIGHLAAIVISFAKILVISTRPGTETLGRLPGVDIYGDVNQYSMAVETPEALIIRIKSALLCFVNANSVKERILRRVSREQDQDDAKGNANRKIALVVLDMTNLISIDTSGIASLEELYSSLLQYGIELMMINPRWQVMHKLRVAGFLDKAVGERRVFMTVADALDASLSHKKPTI